MADPVKTFKKGRLSLSAKKARAKKPNTKKVDMSKVSTKDNLNRAIFPKEMSLLQDSMINRNYPLILRLAILATAMQEGSPNMKGIGGSGYLGLSPERMPVELIKDLPAQITFLLDDIESTHSNNWLDGGKGGITINSGQEGHNMFWNATDVNTATQVLNKSYVRPAAREKDWNDRSKVAKTLESKSK